MNARVVNWIFIPLFIIAIIYGLFLFLRGPEIGIEYGPENEWPHALISDFPDDLSCEDESMIAGSARLYGERAINFVLKDQNDQNVELCQFYGRDILLFFTSRLCIADNSLTRIQVSRLNEIHEDFKDEGLMVIMVLQTDRGETPTVDHAHGLAERFELDYPVLVDPESKMLRRYFVSDNPSKLVIIDRDLRYSTIDSCPGMSADEPLCQHVENVIVDLGYTSESEP